MTTRLIALLTDHHALLAEIRRRVAKYSEDQPRVPAGSPDGGQWTSGEGGGGSDEVTGNSPGGASRGTQFIADEYRRFDDRVVRDNKEKIINRFKWDRRINQTSLESALDGVFGIRVGLYVRSSQAHERFLQKMRDTWNGTSGDHSKTAVAMQMAIEKEFGLNGSTLDHVDRDTFAGAKEMFDKHGLVLQAGARAMYDQTQEHLANNGITNVNLYRGMVVNKSDSRSDTSSIVSQPISSFSVNPNTAMAFAGQSKDASRDGLFIIASVPASQVFSYALTGGLSTEHEDEVVVLGKPIEARTLYLSKYSKDDILSRTKS